MIDQINKTLTVYADLYRLISALIGADLTDCDHEYYPFNSRDASEGFLEVILPVVDSAGRMLRGAGGNGPIFVFLYRRGTWKYLGEMYGAKVVAHTGADTTEFAVYSHFSAHSGIERWYILRNCQYVCVSESNVDTTAESE